MSAGRRTVIRGGTVADGSGAAPFEADVEIVGDRITAVGQVPAGPGEEIAAQGLLVTPGFVDVHTHYDGQVTWAERLLPSSAHGVTTAAIGNCGVGFAPCRPQDRERLVRLMEGVEDIPGIVFAEGLPWAWETFPQYLDFLAGRRFDMDVGAYLPHAALRVYAMGARGARREPATAADRQAMRALACEAVRAGAFGFSTSRSIHHRSSDGANTPMYEAATQELVEIALGLRDAGAGLLQVVAGFTQPVEDVGVLRAMAGASGRPLSVSLAQNHERPGDWRRILGLLQQGAGEGLQFSAQVCGRPVGMLLGLDMPLHPFSYHPGYRAIAQLPLAERLQRMRGGELRAALLAEQPERDAGADPRTFQRATDLEGIYELGDPPDYEPPPACSIAARARAAGIQPRALAYELLLRNEGRLVLFRPLHNYADGNLDVCREMLLHPLAVPGLGDGGAHCGYICDASLPTFMLTHWVGGRQRGERLPLERVVQALTHDGAALLGLHDRGRIAPGLKADLNLIDVGRLRLRSPRAVPDLPGGGRRLLQDAEGYVATLVSGQLTRRDDRATDALPGRLLRGAAAQAGAR